MVGLGMSDSVRVSGGPIDTPFPGSWSVCDRQLVTATRSSSNVFMSWFGRAVEPTDVGFNCKGLLLENVTPESNGMAGLGFFMSDPFNGF